jgi:hypothetical protein
MARPGRIHDVGATGEIDALKRCEDLGADVQWFSVALTNAP